MTLRVLIVLALAACACAKTGSGLSGTITADGSSTVYPLTAAVTENFVKTHPDVKVTVGISGTTGGFTKFCRGEIDVQNASRPISTEEAAECERHGTSFIEIPVAYDALTIIVHPANQWATSMSLLELKRLWEPRAERKVTRWRDLRADWPDEPIALYGPGPASGTFDHFTEVVVGTLRASRADYTASENDSVITDGVAANQFALGYVGYSHFAQHAGQLRAVAIAGPHADRLGAVLPSVDNVQRGTYHPLSRTLLIYLNAKSAERPEISAFMTFYLKQDEDLIRQVAGIPMSARAYELVRQRVARKVPGSLFDEGRDNGNVELILSQAR
jgi:phosphate transport system substrate-binding protein